MQIFIKGLTGTTYTYDVGEADIVKDIHRYHRDKYGMEISSQRLVYSGVQLKIYDKISDVLPADATVHLVLRMLAGPAENAEEKLEVLVDLPFLDKPVTMNITRYPSDLIGGIIDDVLEELDKETPINEDLHEKIEMYHRKCGVLHPSSRLAEYKELSRSYVTFNMSNVKYDDPYIQNVMRNNFFYQSYPIGKKIKGIPKLTLRTKTRKLPKYKEGCFKCGEMYRDVQILINCRHKMCSECRKVMNKCPCGKKINID